MTKRPNQVLFYADEESQKILGELGKGDRSEFINQAIAFYREYKAGGAMYPLQKAYETLKLMPTPEAEAVRKALREILWRRSDTPETVLAKIYLKDGSCIVDYFADMDKAILIAMERSDSTKMELYNKQKSFIGLGTRTANDTFAWDFAPS